ncbi:MAG TPA: hypothetical protein PLY87_01550 [Planctomycetaceae bacterium]|nr:hypothetical protein [Planctomycetaceae bacterium]
MLAFEEFEKRFLKNPDIQQDSSDDDPVLIEKILSIEDLDEIDDEQLHELITEVGGVDAFLEIRSHTYEQEDSLLTNEGEFNLSKAVTELNPTPPLGQRELAIDLIKQYMRDKCSIDEAPQLMPVSDELYQLACEALRYPSGESTPRQRLDLYECIAEAHLSFLHEIADETPRTKDTNPPTRTTMLSSERTTLLMATENPAWVLRREARLEELRRLNPVQARIFLLGEYAGCDPGVITVLLNSEAPIELLSETLAATELAAARTYCLM